MPTFKYRAKENTGNTVEGVIEALTSDEAVDKISRLGYLPVRVEEARSPVQAEKTVEKQRQAPSPRKGVLGSKVRGRDITIFSQQLSSLLRAGVPILQGIALIADPAENAAFKALLSGIYNEIKEGSTFSQALSKHPKLFPPLYIALISAGESSGNLHQVLGRITEYRQKQEAVISQMRSAMTYPVLMALTGIGTIVFMLTFVLPRLMGIFSTLGGQLPLPTRILIQTSHTLQKGWFWGVGVVAAFLLFIRQSKKVKAQRLAFSAMQLQLPVIGPLTVKAEIAQFSRTLELLLKSGLPILRAIEVAMPVVSNELFQIEFTQCLKDLREGGSFGKSLRKSKRFPVFMTNLIVIGEQSGKLDEALSEIAAFYERETDEAIRAMTSLFEPLMILVMGAVVGFIVIAMLLPMFELNMMVR